MCERLTKERGGELSNKRVVFGRLLKFMSAVMTICEDQELAPERQVVVHQVAEAAVDDLQDFLGEHCALPGKVQSVESESRGRAGMSESSTRARDHTPRPIVR